MEELLKNMNLVHTTPMGVDRIRKNIGLDNNTNPVEYCKSLILSADSIIRNG